MSNPTDSQTPSNEALQEQLHPILQEWSQLIVSLASLIRENVEGLLPAVFGLAGLAQRASEAKMGASVGAREAGATLREHARELRGLLQPLADAVTATRSAHDDMAGFAEEARRLGEKHAGDAELSTFLQRVAASQSAGLPQVANLVERAEAVETAGLGTLDQLENGLDTIDRLLHADTAELEAAASRVKHFVESSRSAIDQLIVKLQFQDRTDQILQHLLADFESLRSALSEVGAQPFDVDAWRQQRAKRFTTNEERNAGSGNVSTDAGDIELF